jgi:hypothetical protein
MNDLLKRAHFDPFCKGGTLTRFLKCGHSYISCPRLRDGHGSSEPSMRLIGQKGIRRKDVRLTGGWAFQRQPCQLCGSRRE